MDVVARQLPWKAATFQELQQAAAHLREQIFSAGNFSPTSACAWTSAMVQALKKRHSTTYSVQMIKTNIRQCFYYAILSCSIHTMQNSWGVA